MPEVECCLMVVKVGGGGGGDGGPELTPSLEAASLNVSAAEVDASPNASSLARRNSTNFRMNEVD